ncbi:MAG: hypothetical protein F6K26_25400 [Moorea sp. SIO2I5]|nr:hypothetical protein [Moorena sp. SIO2I5]
MSEQKAVLSKSMELLSAYDVVVLGDREFCSTKLGHWLAERKVYFCLRQKCDTKVLPESDAARSWGASAVLGVPTGLTRCGRRFRTQTHAP